MPANAHDLAQRYLLLTQNLIEAVKTETSGTLNALFDARDETLDQLDTVTLDDAARSVLREALEKELELQAALGGEMTELRGVLTARFQEKRGVHGYRSAEHDGQMDDSIAC